MSAGPVAEDAAVISLEQLLLDLRSLGILTEEEIQELPTAAPADAGPECPSRLVRQLVDRGKLTPYQSDLILQGRWREISLGDYCLLKKIGEGGMGQVYLAMHRHMQRRVALKLLPESTALSEGAAERFRREIRTIARLSHPNIVAAYDAGEDRGLLYLVMEYVEGETLHDLVSRRGSLAVAEAVRYLVQVAHGLQAAHARGIIHRDIKPSNLLCDHSGMVKILDLGLARLARPAPGTISGRGLDTLTGSDQIVGTIDYMAPEQAAAGGMIDHRADIYSLGCCLYFLLTGQPLYQRSTLLDRLLAHREDPIPSLCKARLDVPPELDAVFRRMVAKQPADRFASVEGLLEALDPGSLRQVGGFQDGISALESNGAVPPFVPPVTVRSAALPRRTRRRTRIAAAAVVLAFTVLAAIAAWISIAWRHASKQAGEAGHARRQVDLTPELTLRGHTNTVECLAFLPGGTKLVSGDDDELILVWDLAGGKLDFEFAKGGQTGPCLAIDPSGTRLATASGGDVVKLWDLPARTELVQLAGQRVAFSPAGRLLAIADDNRVTLYDAEARRTVGNLIGQDETIFALVFSQDGRTLISGDILGIAVVWDVEKQRQRLTLENRHIIYTSAVAPDASTAAIGCDDGAIRLWSLADGRLEATLTGSGPKVLGVAFSLDGKRLASVGGDGAVTLWDAVSRKHIASWKATNRGESCAVAFSPDGHRLASGGEDLSVRLWDLNSLTESRAGTDPQGARVLP